MFKFKWFKKGHKEEDFPLAALDPATGSNYVIQNCDVDQTFGRQVIALLLPDKTLTVAGWEGEHSRDKMFKIQSCSDFAEDIIAITYGLSPNLQWFVDGTSLKIKEYPNKDKEEWRRPPFKQWRFSFEETQKGSKRYRIISRDEGLDSTGCNCLCITTGQNGQRNLEFVQREEDDKSQLWCLHLR